jgi:hypothetical protein
MHFIDDLDKAVNGFLDWMKAQFRLLNEEEYFLEGGSEGY